VPFWHIDTGKAALLILQTMQDEGLGTTAATCSTSVTGKTGRHCVKPG
jgi:hypothetical protein